MVGNKTSPAIKLLDAVDAARDHVRDHPDPDAATMVVYADYLCPYCRRLRRVISKLQEALGPRLAYVFRHFPNEQANPGSKFLAQAAEAAAKQDRFWEMHDWIFEHELPLSAQSVQEHARSLGLDMKRFGRDVEAEETVQRVEQDIAAARRNGVTGTPTVFIDGMRYDGAWDFCSMLEAVERPVAARVQSSARAFANLPASGGLVLLLAAAAALVLANTPLSPYYREFIDSPLGIGPQGGMLTLTVRAWFSEGLLGVFFLLVGLGIRRELLAGSLADHRVAILPVLAAVGGAAAPAAIYLVFNSGPAASGWSVPTATDVAFALGILAVLGDRIPLGLRVFVAALGVVDDVLSVLMLAIFYAQGFEPRWLLASGGAVALLVVFNRWRVYAGWPYVLTTIALAVFLHAAGVHAALAGVLLAAFLPARPSPAPGPLLAQAATALAELEHAEREASRAGLAQPRIEQEPIWDWAARNLSAASERLLSPADRIERAIGPWSAYLILPLFAFSATGVDLRVDISCPATQRILLGVMAGLLIGKPLGITLTAWFAIKAGIAVTPENVTMRNFIGAACLCGIGDTVALLLAEQAFSTASELAVAKIAVLLGSILAATAGAVILSTSSQTRRTEYEPAASRQMVDP